MKYAIITPTKNEGKYIRQTIESVISQTVLPVVWVIIDGGSSDNTRDIIKKYIEKHPWIVLRHQLKFSHSGGHTNVSIATNEAYEFLKWRQFDFDYLFAIDADQTMDSNICEGLIQHMDADSTSGVSSGQAYNGTVPDTYPDGELTNKRMYRRTALDSIGGFPITKYSFDSVVLAKLRMRNFGIVVFPEYKITNIRPDTGIERNAWKSSVQFGKSKYYLGYSLPLLVLGCGYLVLHRKVIKSIGVFVGYIESMILRDDVIEDSEVRNHFHNDRLKEVLKL